MSHAFVIEIRGVEAGLVVRDAAGRFRFFASVRAAFAFEGRAFRSAADARKAVASALEAEPARDMR